ncbi:MAG: hypothetical protein ACYCZ6_01120 [Polaromonas sp.]
MVQGKSLQLLKCSDHCQLRLKLQIVIHGVDAQPSGSINHWQRLENVVIRLFVAPFVAGKMDGSNSSFSPKYSEPCGGKKSCRSDAEHVAFLFALYPKDIRLPPAMNFSLPRACSGFCYFFNSFLCTLHVG